jgi:hypothetical protein
MVCVSIHHSSNLVLPPFLEVMGTRSKKLVVIGSGVPASGPSVCTEGDGRRATISLAEVLTFPTRSVVLAGRIDESLHDRILEVWVH